MDQKLQNQIENKLATLEKVIEKIRNKVIDSNDGNIRDNSYYYDLATQLKEALDLLQDQQDNKLNEWGEPIVLETGILSLLDEWGDKKEGKE